MLTPGSAQRIWLCTRPTDMGRAFDRLLTMVRHLLGRFGAFGRYLGFGGHVRRSEHCASAPGRTRVCLIYNPCWR